MYNTIITTSINDCILYFFIFCFGQCEHVNINPNIHVFQQIVHLKDRYTSDDQVKELITRWVKHVPKQTMSIFVDYLLRKSMKVDDWLHNFNKSNYILDKMGLYILSRILGTGIGVVLKNSVWTTKKIMEWMT